MVGQLPCGGEGELGNKWQGAARGHTVIGFEGSNEQFGLCPKGKAERWVPGSFGSGWTQVDVVQDDCWCRAEGGPGGRGGIGKLRH